MQWDLTEMTHKRADQCRRALRCYCFLFRVEKFYPSSVVPAPRATTIMSVEFPRLRPVSPASIVPERRSLTVGLGAEA